ncbi:MAG: alcohol dehydrogenase catalytic domain-containing protein [Anaerolineae bacterium]|nr:alcohol dehydrogenase catalytic domain-containing protein [Anaerolineae bacterium]
MPETVKAAVMVAPGKVELQELPYPDHLEPGAVIVKMEMSGICGTDKHAFKNELTLYGGTQSEQDMVFPSVHGHENAGIVVEMNGRGGDIEYSGQDLKVGDRVTNCPNVICGRCWYCRNVHGYPYCAEHQGIGMTYYADRFPYIVGGWAEYMYLPPKAWVYKVPEYLSVEYACMAELFVVTALLDRAKELAAYGGKGFHFGDTVVIQGAGAVGMMMVAKARLLGAGKIIALDTMGMKLEMSKEFGADKGINVSGLSDEELVEMIRDETEGRGADVVVETVGQPDVVKVGLEMLRRGGTYLETGNFVDTGGTVTLNVHRHVAAKNVLLYGNTNHPHDGYYRAMEMMYRYRDAFPFEKLITHRYKLDQAQEAMEKSFEEDALKVVFMPSA